MIRVVALACFLVALPFLAGCGTDPARDTLSQIKATGDDASSKLSALKESIKKVAKDHREKLAKTEESSRKKVKIEVDDLKPIFDEVEKMRKVSKDKMVALKAQAEKFKVDVADDQKKALAEEFQSEFAQLAKRIDDNYRDVLKEWVELDKLVSEETVKVKLWGSIRDAQEEFAVITRQK